MKKNILVILLLLCLTLTACTPTISKSSINLMDNIQKSNVKPIDISNLKDQQGSREGITDFSFNLFRESFEDKNILVSPLSIVSALGMLANGAKGNTLKEMEQVLNTDIAGLNDYLKAYAVYLPNSDKYKVGLANSIWFKDEEGLTINQDFLQTNKDYYDASVYKAPFDESTKDDINNWVKENTNHMIEKLLEKAPPKDAVMYLINALSFDAEWATIYHKNEIIKADFHSINGEKQTAEFMSSSEFGYLENDMATGFIKPYKDNKYAFVALLPKEDIPLSEFFDSFSGSAFKSLIEEKKDIVVSAKTPKFTTEYNALLNEPLQHLGMIEAFDAKNADLSALGKSVEGNLYVSRVIHKTKIDVDERGTKAGAVTAVEIMKETSMVDTKEVILNRPFFYMIIDLQQNLPLFMGALTNLK